MPDNHDTLKEDLEKIYTDVSEWLKFAEAKHAAVIALWTALIIAILSGDLTDYINFTSFCIILILIIFGMSLDLLAFMPFTNNSRLLSELCYKSIKRKYRSSDNLIFYQNIFLLVAEPGSTSEARVDKYKKKLKEQYGTIPQDKMIDSYIQQIISVSAVGTIKVFLFSLVIRYIGTLIFLAFICIIIA